MLNQIDKLKKVIKEIILETKVVPLSRDKTSNSVKDYFDSISAEESSLKDYYIIKQVNKNGEEIIQVYTKNSNGSKGDYLYSINGDESQSNLHINYVNAYNHKNNKNKPY